MYCGGRLSALEPAEAEADEEKKLTAPAPLAPEEALRLDVEIVQLGGILSASAAAVSRIT